MMSQSSLSAMRAPIQSERPRSKPETIGFNKENEMKGIVIQSLIFAILFAGGCGPSKIEKSVAVDDSNFEEVVLKADKPVLVDFWATWCGPCKQIAPVVEELASDYEGRVVVAKLDVDVAEQTALKYKVSSIPTLIIFKDGQEVARLVGVQDKSALSAKLDEALKASGN